MKQKKQMTEAEKKIRKENAIVLSVVLIVTVVFGWAGLTKAGYIDNYFGIDILCCEPGGYFSHQPVLKPVIYLYPQTATNIFVGLDYNGKIIADYPDYDYSIKGWNVFAYPDGRIINNKDRQEYSYLFWEGESASQASYDLSKGFVVKGSDTKSFLQNKLSEMGLTPKEYNEFIVYWYPRMKNNNYNLIHFADKEYTDTAPLNITPKPDSMLRVFMVFKPLNAPVDVATQEFQHFERKGFTVVEWGGTEIESEY
jgi:hypothetical protein